MLSRLLNYLIYPEQTVLIVNGYTALHKLDWDIPLIPGKCVYSLQHSNHFREHSDLMGTLRSQVSHGHIIFRAFIILWSHNSLLSTNGDYALWTLLALYHSLICSTGGNNLPSRHEFSLTSLFKQVHFRPLFYYQALRTTWVPLLISRIHSLITAQCNFSLDNWHLQDNYDFLHKWINRVITRESSEKLYIS